jgi:heme/copper-type cytochrome/quinol oxidase subunit 2
MKLIPMFLFVVLALTLIMTGYQINKELSNMTQEELNTPIEIVWFDVVIVAIVCGIASLPIITRFDKKG